MTGGSEKETKTSSGGLFFSRTGLVVLAGVLFTGGWFGLPGLVYLSGTMFCLAALAKIWSRTALWRLTYGWRLKDRYAFPGEKIDLTATLENRKFLPLFWFESGLTIPESLCPGDARLDPGPLDGLGVLSQAGSLPMYRRQVRTYRLVCRKRGYYPIGPARVVSGDIFGLLPRSMEIDRREYLTVFPKIHDLTGLVLPSREPLGEAVSSSRIFEDPTRVMGLRDYTPGTPFKYVHWKATARRGRLQARVFEPTTTIRACLFLDVGGFVEGEAFESAVSLTASLANHLISLGFPVGCYANALPAGEMAGEIAVRPGAGPGSLIAILEALAKVSARSSRSFDDFFESIRGGLAWGSTVCLVSSGLGETTLGQLDELRVMGFRVVVFQAGDAPLPPGTLIDVRRAQNLGEACFQTGGAGT